jgi:tetratricopeptide (TPR) repeat protein
MPEWLGVLIEELRKDSEFATDDLLDAFWLARWTTAAVRTEPVLEVRESAVSDQTAVEPLRETSSAIVSEARVEPARRRESAGLKPDEIGIYSPSSKPAQPDATKASPIRLPGTFALPRVLEFGRALRPLKQYRWSHTRSTLDVDATIVFFERHRQLIPQLRPEPEKWFDIAMVTDDSPSMAVWRRTFAELERLLSTHGAFRRVRRFVLTDCLKGAEAKRDPLQDPERRTLILFFTDGASAVWHRQDLIECMRKWAATAPMGIVQMFPSYHWPATTLGRATRDVQAPAPGVPNQQLTVSRTWRGDLPAKSVAVPITSLEPEALGQWANMLVAKRGTWNPAVVLYPRSGRVKRAEESPSPQRQVENFRKTASPAAFDLACYLSTVPLSLPVMRVVMEAMIPRPQLSYLAQVLASGLVRAVESEVGTDPELVQYAFDAEVGDLLRAQVRVQEAAQAQEAVQHEVQRFVEKLAGRRLSSDVFLVPDEWGKLNLPKSAEAFLRVKYELAARLRFKVQPLGVLHNVPELPQPFLERPIALEGLVQRISSTQSDINVGGTGCQVMAAAAVRDIRVRRAYPGGIYWKAHATPPSGRALYVMPRPYAPIPQGVIVVWLPGVAESPSPFNYELSPVLKEETDAYFMGQGLTGEQASELEVCHKFDPNRCLILARALKVFGATAVLRLPAICRDPVIIFSLATDFRRLVLNSLFPAETRTVVPLMRTFIDGNPVPRKLVEYVISPRLEMTSVDTVWTMAAQMEFCEDSDSLDFHPLRWGLRDEFSDEAALSLDSRVVDYYFQFFDEGWDRVRFDRYLFRNLLRHLERMRDFARMEQVLLDPYWHACKAALFGLQHLDEGYGEISGTRAIVALGQVVLKARAVFDSLAPEDISAKLVTLVRNEPGIAHLTSVVERNLRRGFPSPEVSTSTAQWVLVAGTGRYQLPPYVVRLAEELGKTLAARRLNLIGGGWQGVDSVVGRWFADAVQASGDLVENRFLQVLPPGVRPDLAAGRIVHSEFEFGENVTKADAVVLIGGLGGTYNLFLEAMRQKKPVYPLPTTGGDAEQAFDELLAFEGKRGLSTRRLGLLEVGIENDSGIRVLLNRLTALLEGAHREREWADAMLKLMFSRGNLRDEKGSHELWGYISKLAASAELATDERGLEYFLSWQHSQPDSPSSFALERLRNCLPAASIWISFDILCISAIADSSHWNKGAVMDALMSLFFEFAPEDAEWTLARAVWSATPTQLLVAADGLRKRYKSALAERLYRWALNSPLDNLQDQAAGSAAHAGLGRIAILQGKLVDAKESFRQAHAARIGGQDLEGLSSLHDDSATVFFLQGDMTQAKDQQELALRTAGIDPRERSVALNHLGRIQRTLGDFRAAEKTVLEALRLAREAGFDDVIVAATTELGVVYRHVDTLPKAEDEQRRALEVSERIGDPALTAQVLNNFAGVLRLRGELFRAEEMNRRALALYEAMGARAGVADSYEGIGLGLRVRGKLPEAEYHLRLALDINNQIGRRFGVADNYNGLGPIHRASGDIDEAQRMHDLAFEINEKAARLPDLADTYNSLGLVSLLRGDPSYAIDRYQQALSLNESMGRESGVADSLANLGAAYRRMRNLEEAHSCCERALRINEKIGRVPSVARTYTSLGHIANARLQPEIAESYFLKALKLNEDMGRLEGIAENKYQLGRLARKRRDRRGRALMLEALDIYEAGGFLRRAASIQRELGASKDP